MNLSKILDGDWGSFSTESKEECFNFKLCFIIAMTSRLLCFDKIETMNPMQPSCEIPNQFTVNSLEKWI
jgi:hypothetical protein